MARKSLCLQLCGQRRAAAATDGSDCGRGRLISYRAAYYVLASMTIILYSRVFALISSLRSTTLTAVGHFGRSSRLISLCIRRRQRSSRV